MKIWETRSFFGMMQGMDPDNSSSQLFVPRDQAKKIAEHSVSTFYEYDLPFNKFSVGVSEIHGRYPEKGYDVDTEVEAVWYVASGSGKVYVAENTYEVQEGDMIMIPQNEKFWIKGNHLKLVVTSSPKWTPEQHKHLEE